MQLLKIKFNSEGFKEILCSGGVQSLVSEKGSEIAATASANNTRGGAGFRCETFMGGYGGGRWIATVKPNDMNAKIAESEDKALSRAVM